MGIKHHILSEETNVFDIQYTEVSGLLFFKYLLTQGVWNVSRSRKKM